MIGIETVGCEMSRSPKWCRSECDPWWCECPQETSESMESDEEIIEE